MQGGQEQEKEREKEKGMWSSHHCFSLASKWVAAAVYFQWEKFAASHCHVAWGPCSAGQSRMPVLKKNNELLLEGQL